MLKRLAFGITALLILVGVPAAIIANSAQFRYCIHEKVQNTPAPNQTVNNNSPGLPASGSYIGCIGQFANDNGNGITALSTLLLMVITASLAFIGYMQIQTSRRQLRAYIFADSGAIVDGVTPRDAPVIATSGCPWSRVLIKNFGQTPAYDVRHFSRIDICPSGQEDRIIFPVSIAEHAISVIGPNGCTTADRSLVRQLTAFEIQALATAAQNLVVHGRIEYRDVFGVLHFTRYRFVYAGTYPPVAGMTLLFAGSGNSSN